MDHKTLRNTALATALAFLALAVAPSGQAIGVWTDVSPTGQDGNIDCTYNSTANRSLVMEKWTITVWVGTTSAGNPNPPIVTLVLPYPVPSVDNGDTCAGSGTLWDFVNELISADEDDGQ